MAFRLLFVLGRWILRLPPWLRIALLGWLFRLVRRELRRRAARMARR
jgi:hypothetical protein